MILLPFLLTFLAAGGATFITLTHYRPRLMRALEREEAEVRSAMNILYVEEWSPRSFVYLRFVGAPVAAFVVYLVTLNWMLALGVASMLHVLPRTLLDYAGARRRERLEAQVLDLISSLVATAKAGMNLHQSLHDVTGRLPPPISQECQVILHRIETGQAMEAALLETDRRLALPNLSLVIQSLVVNERRGGKLPALLERIALSLREIERVEERVQTETSGIKLASRIMAAMPLVILLLLYLASPEHVLMLFQTTLGNLLLAVALGFDYLGFTMIRKLSELEV